MKTTVNELKELDESLGGTPSDVADITTIPDMIAALAEVAGTTIELPAVSSTDNGDVLTVVSGKWAKADPPTELPTSATSGQVLTYSGSAWGAANVPAELPASATSGQVLTYNGSSWGAANAPTEMAFFTIKTVSNVLDGTTAMSQFDMTAEELAAIFAAHESGKHVFLSLDVKSTSGYYHVPGALLETSGSQLVGNIPVLYSNNIYILQTILMSVAVGACAVNAAHVATS